jgi:hypothetical protein
MSARFSAASEDSTSDSPEQAMSTDSSARPIPTGEKSSPDTGRECPSTPMSETLAFAPKQGGRSMPVTAESLALESKAGNAPPAIMVKLSQTGANGSNVTRDHSPTLDETSGRLAVLTSLLEDSPAKTSPLQDADEGSPATDQDSSLSSPESQTLFDPNGFSSRTYPDCSPRTAVGTSESCLERWPTSGMAWDGGFSTAVSSECRSAAGECSSSETTLADVLEPNVPQRFYLSARAARGILRRAEKRGRELPPALAEALSVPGRRQEDDKPSSASANPAPVTHSLTSDDASEDGRRGTDLSYGSGRRTPDDPNLVRPGHEAHGQGSEHDRG